MPRVSCPTPKLARPTTTTAAKQPRVDEALDIETIDDATLVTALLNGRASTTVLGRKTSRFVKAEAVARDVLDAFGGIGGIARASVDEIAALLVLHVDIDTTKNAIRDVQDDAFEAASALASAFELGRRAAAQRAVPPSRLRDSRDAAAWGMARLGPLEHEELWLLAVDGRSRLRAVRRVAQGGIHGASVRAADPLRHALRVAASGFVLVHNHPSGDPTPSPEDVKFTRAVADAAATVGVPLLDHLVVTADAFTSITPGSLA